MIRQSFNFKNLNLTPLGWNEFLENEKHKNKERQTILSPFVKSIIFHKIIGTIFQKNILLDNEQFNYFPEKTLSLFNIEGLTFENLKNFIDCFSDDEIIIPQKTETNKEIIFENETTTKLGLKVFKMWGQGCCIQIFPETLLFKRVFHEN